MPTDGEKQDGGRNDPAEGEALPQVGGDRVIARAASGRVPNSSGQCSVMIRQKPSRNHLRIEAHALRELGDVAVRPVQIRNRRPWAGGG